ncbi:transposase, partial [Burkholderia gladioli]|uniref:transposase n=3 Tax=Burkholderia gladioli TaxID=28095 RepID=UPI0020B3A075
MNKKSSKFSPEVRERAVRLVREQRSEHPSLWAAVESIAPMIGCTPQTLNDWVKRDEIDNGERDGLTTNERERLKALERENKELRKTNEILKLARVGSMDGCNTFLLISNEGGLTNGTNGKAGVVARRQVRGLAAVA